MSYGTSIKAILPCPGEKQQQFDVRRDHSGYYALLAKLLDEGDVRAHQRNHSACDCRFVTGMIEPNELR